jgi:hypothetical protein
VGDSWLSPCLLKLEREEGGIWMQDSLGSVFFIECTVRRLPCPPSSIAVEVARHSAELDRTGRLPTRPYSPLSNQLRAVRWQNAIQRCSTCRCDDSERHQYHGRRHGVQDAEGLRIQSAYFAQPKSRRGMDNCPTNTWLLRLGQENA